MDYTPTYWATIAQILPVVMLALVVEGRAVARNLSKKKVYNKTRGVRVLYSILFVLNVVGIFLAFQIALSGARGVDIGPVSRSIVLFGLSFGISTVFLTPLIAVCSALMGDWVITQWHRTPFSRIGRAMRTLERQMLTVKALARDFRATTLEQRMSLARSYVDVYRNADGSRDSDAKLTLLDETRADLDERVRSLSEGFESIYADERSIRSKREIIDSDFEHMRELIRRTTY